MRFRTKYRVLCMAGIAVLALVVTACSSSSKKSSGAPPAAKNGTVAMTIDGPLTGYDPALTTSFQDSVADGALYDTLVNLDQSSKLIPGLATSWTSTTTTATFQLKSGVTCSDGTALTSAMVAASLTRLFDPKTKAPLVGQAIGSGNTATVTSDATSVKITLAKPWSDLLSGMAGPYAGIVCPAGLKDPSALKTKSAGTGAFVSASQVAGSSYTLTRRSGYTWGAKLTGQPDGTPPKTLVLRVVTDENTRANLTATGELQIPSFATNSWSRFKSVSAIKVATSAQSDTMLVFNETAGHPTAQQSVRLAISQAIQRSALNNVQSFSAGTLMSSIGQSTDECYDKGTESQIPKYDAGAAAKALKGVKLRIIGTNLLAGGDANNYLLSALQAAGASASVNSMDNQSWVSDLFGGKNDWDITILVYGNRLGSFLQIGQFFVHAAPPAGLNIGGTDNPDAATAFDKAAVSDEAGKCSALGDFQHALLQNNDVLPLATAPVHILFAGGTSAVVVNGFAVTSTIRLGKA